MEGSPSPAEEVVVGRGMSGGVGEGDCEAVVEGEVEEDAVGSWEGGSMGGFVMALSSRGCSSCVSTVLVVSSTTFLLDFPYTRLNSKTGTDTTECKPAETRLFVPDMSILRSQIPVASFPTIMRSVYTTPFQTMVALNRSRMGMAKPIEAWSS